MLTVHQPFIVSKKERFFGLGGYFCLCTALQSGIFTSLLADCTTATGNKVWRSPLELPTELTANGYVFIGMEHFAKPNDELAIAQRNGQPHRNFQRYTTQPESDLFGFGMTSISMLYALGGWSCVIYGVFLRSVILWHTTWYLQIRNSACLIVARKNSE